MLSNKSSAVWASATNTSATNWNAYQLALTGNSQQFSIVSATTTSTNLSTYDGYNITSGQGMLLSTNGTSFTSGNAGVVTTTAPSTFSPSKVAGSSSAAASPITTIYTSTQASAVFMKPDGTRFWNINSGTIYEYTLSTPFNLTTAALNGRTLVTSGNFGMCFSTDGQYLIAGANGIIYVYQLSSAWDITTAGTAQSYLLGVASYCGQMQLSPDGTKLVVVNGAPTNIDATNYGKIYVYTLSTPFNFATLVTPATYISGNYGGFGLNSGVFFTPDGKTMSVFQSAYNSTPAGSITTYSLTTPWSSASGNLTQLGSTYNLVMTDFNSPTSFSNGTFLCVNPNGTQMYVGYNGNSTKGLATYTIDLNTKYNVNITSFGLGAAPTQAYYAAPSVSVDLETQANRVNMFPYQLDFTSSTTSQAIVNAYGAASGGVIQTGDAILLNGTTSVTTTGVTQGNVGAIAAKNLGKTDNYISYSGKFGSVGTACSGLRFKPDGSSFICTPTSGTYANFVVQFGMSTPWDVSTLYGPIAIYNPKSLAPFTAGVTYVGCEFNADGSRLILQGNNSSNQWIAAEYSLGQPYNISTVRSFIAQSSNIDTTVSSVWGGRFNLTGTQFYGLDVSGSTYAIKLLSCPTPFSIVGASVTNVSNTTNYVGSTMPLLEPNGNFIITSLSYMGEQTLTINNDITSFTNTIDVSAGSTGFINTNAVTPGINYFYAQDFSVDGTKWYGIAGNGNIYQYNVRTRPLTQYTCSFATQASAPTSVYLPDRSSSQTITTAASSGNMTFSAPLVNSTGKAIAMKITSPYQNTTITNATLSLYK